VLCCKTFLTGKSGDESRITTVGFAPDHPVASNEREAGRAQNRRVEMKLT
jgi:outer membrane protein OmpA-like peptidoglycan-associated protein